MDYKIIWLDDTLEELEAALRFIAADNPTTASRLGEAILNKVGLLARFPKLGRVYPKLNQEEVREILASPYWVIYRVDDGMKTVSILTVWHVARREPEIR